MKFMLIAWLTAGSLFLILKVLGTGTELDATEKLFGLDPAKHPVLTCGTLIWMLSIIVAIVATFRFVILL